MSDTPEVPEGADLTPKAYGQSEFNVDPASFLNLPGVSDSLNLVESLKPAAEKKLNVNADDKQNRIDAMKDILLKMNNEAEFTIDQSLRAPEGKKLSKKLITESYSDNDWQIQVNENMSKQEYLIVNKYSKKSFFDSLYLLEAAKKICALLENGHPVNSKKVQEVLYYDDIYRNAYDECKNFKRLHKSLKEKREYSRMNVIADKYEVTKSKALKAKKAIGNI